ncbi:short-chain dehydrogenase [Chitinispirillum alkaliphilum]|nr:short-chain dehydrogenase [Chitinispirillum alkaliphilum]
MGNLNGKWALVTGSNRGIGQQIAKCLASHECNVIIHGRTEEGAKQTLEMLEPYNVEKKVICGELNNEKSVQGIINTVLEQVGHVDILYNNAGIQNEWKEVFDISLAEWKELFQINLFSIVQLNQAFIPLMIKRGWGRVIITTSGIQDIPQMMPYGVSKAGVDKYCKDLVPELENTGVKINSLDPGWLRTDLGGPEGEYAVETVIPGALAPLLLDDKIVNGASYHAHDYKDI